MQVKNNSTKKIKYAFLHFIKEKCREYFLHLALKNFINRNNFHKIFSFLKEKKVLIEIECFEILLEYPVQH